MEFAVAVGLGVTVAVGLGVGLEVAVAVGLGVGLEVAVGLVSGVDFGSGSTVAGRPAVDPCSMMQLAMSSPTDY